MQTTNEERIVALLDLLQLAKSVPAHRELLAELERITQLSLTGSDESIWTVVEELKTSEATGAKCWRCVCNQIEPLPLGSSLDIAWHRSDRVQRLPSGKRSRPDCAVSLQQWTSVDRYKRAWVRHI